ncbi:phosphotriesterase-related protein [Fodinicola feengrottensis]|uniref:Phosphotriesterase-related protein n=1 Tax=Fodinicola feengrottensis TaxID=435914 RepID=A0ABN2H7K1_9ACTN
MSRVRTVMGDVDTDQLGVMFAHEHLLMTGGWPVLHEPDYRLDDLPAAATELRAAAAHGLSAVVEMTPLGFGRSPRGLAQLARETGVAIIATTGFHKVEYYDDLHWLHRYSADQISRLLIEEITVGMDEYGLVGPYADRTDARAGVIKIGTRYHRLGRSIGKLIEAVGMAHQETGAPVATHNDKGTCGHEVLDALVAAGVQERHVVLGHIDHNADPGLLAELAARGAYLAFDRPGRIKYAPDSDSVALLVAVAERGGADRLLLGCDLARRSYWRSLGGGPGLDYLLRVFAPRMRAEGHADLVDAALTVNPARAFALR